ncbi:YjdJ family protein [Bacillus sp. 165]|uniref:YjdJ family protein n=1 Tax=Bacillus sp. 165 TaxID=1529117 RepID=UPI001AD9647D|nr:YjdJ family protein [Bacillus sp. 165]MBO9129449.1 YjdJ family protein [Bacillus sp. 165]
MKIIHLVQLGFCFIVFIVSTLLSWYQGSQLVDRPDEWKYTAKFTKWLYKKEKVYDYHDISQLDFFVYTAKFYPIYTIVMITSFLYLILLAGYLVIKKRQRVPS